MQKVEFDIDKNNLLRDVISKQTGSLNKAIKELFQNSFDAEATEIHVTMNTKGLRFKDNGIGMNKAEIEKYFRVFGSTLKRDDTTKTGAFGMGRGQIFNFGIVLWRTHNYAMVVDIRKSLDYCFFQTNNYVNGTDIIISFYKPLYSWDISHNFYSIKSDILPPKDIAIYLDGKLYSPTIKEFENFSNDKYFVFVSSNHRQRIYNRNIAVKWIRNSNYQYSIMPYEKLELNFARNELIESAQSTKDLMNYVYDIEETMCVEKVVFDIDEAMNILRMMGEKRFKITSVYEKNIIPLSNGKLISIKDIIENPGMGIVYGEKNIWSDDCLRNDYKVISSDIKGLFNRIRSLYSLKIDFLDKDTKELSRKGFHRELEINKLTRNKMYFYVAVELNDYIFKPLMKEKNQEIRKIHLGFSDISSAWTKPYKDKIWLNKSLIQSFQSKEEAIIRLWEILCHEYAHDTSNIEQDYHNQSFYETFEQHISKTTKLLSSALNYISRKFIKEKYEY